MSKEEIEITKQYLEFIMGEDFKHFPRLEKNVFCKNCEGKKMTEIVFYKIYLLHSSDIVLRGKCKKCNGDVARYIETVENPDMQKRAEELKKNHEKV